MASVVANPSAGNQQVEPLLATTTTNTQRQLHHTSVGPRRNTHAESPLLRQPSILDLLTALPILLSSDHNSYPTILNNVQEQLTFSRAAPLVRHVRGSSAVVGLLPDRKRDGVHHDTYGDAVTTAVRAVLRTSGESPSWKRKRRRLRRVALDAFFHPSLSAQISARADATSAAAASAAADPSDGVHIATMRLLAHTRAVIANVSPTQAHLVDLFAGQILRDTHGNCEAVAAAAGDTSPLKGEGQKEPEGGGDQRTEEALWASPPQLSPRGIMKPCIVPESEATTTKASAVPANKSARSSLSSSSIAEQLLYIILRTSIAANTPLRQGRDNEVAGDNKAGSTLDGNWSKWRSAHTPPSLAAGSTEAFLTSSPTNTASSTSSLMRKKPRTDDFGFPDTVEEEEGQRLKELGDAVDSPSVLFLNCEEDSIRQHPASISEGRNTGAVGTVLPYEPQCWLGPSTVALVESSSTLRRQQRWTCDRDPVIEATIAGEGADLYYVNYAGITGDMSLLDGRRHHWTLVADAGWNSEDANVLASIERDSGLPCSTSTASMRRTARGVLPAITAVPASARSARELRGEAAVPRYFASAQHACYFGKPQSGVLHWAPNDEDGDEEVQGNEVDPAVRLLFVEKADREETQSNIQKTSGTAAELRHEGTKRPTRSEPSAALPTLPVCRTPFVSCNGLYDPAIYAHVYVALHRCTVGLMDPYELTYYDLQAGPNLVEIRVRSELYAKPSPPSRTQKSQQPSLPSMPHSGLTSILVWGCRCGTLVLRLHRLCEAADGSMLRASLGNYGRCAMDTLRVLLCLLQRQIWELGNRAGGAHRLGFAELLTAQQRLNGAVEQVEALAAFFTVPSISASAAVLATKKGSRSVKVRANSPVVWDPVAALQQSCCSALLVSRLHQLFTARHANALGQHDNVAAYYSELQQENLEDWMNSLGDGHKMTINTSRNIIAREKYNRGNSLQAADITVLTDDAMDRMHQRKDLLCHSIDAIGFLLRATLRPFHAMLHRWLTAGELADPYDEFFVVPSHGQTHSGFMLNLSPQRLPVFVSVAAASDLLHAGVSLRVLRAAATHVVLSAQKDACRLQGLAEVTEAAAEDYAEELLDTQTLRSAVQKFIERLVRGAPTVDGINAMGRLYCGVQQDDNAEEESERALPLPPRVDVLSAYGAVNWWRQHYQACTQVLLEAVEEAAGVKTPPPLDMEAERTASAAADTHSAPHVKRGNEEQQLTALPHENSALASTVPSPPSGPSSLNNAPSPSSGPKTALAANEEAEETNTQRKTANSPSTAIATSAASPLSEEGTRDFVYPPGTAPATFAKAHSPEGENNTEEEEDKSPYITVFINSDDDDAVDALKKWNTADHKDGAAVAESLRSSLPSSMSSSVATTSVLGLRRIASSKLSVSTTISSTASSRGTIALYGAITEELRQVSLLERQTEALAGQSRHALRAEFTAQMWRRKREMRLNDWKAQRLALRLRRVRAMESIVDELKDIYGIHGARFSGEPAATTPQNENEEEQNAQGQKDRSPLASVIRFVVPLKHFPPFSFHPPVLLYAEETLGDDERHGHARHPSRGLERPRRTSFAATATVIEPPSEVEPYFLPPSKRRSASFAVGASHLHRGILLPPRSTRTRSMSGPDFLIGIPPTPPPVQEEARKEAKTLNSLTNSTRALYLREGVQRNGRSHSSPVAVTHTFVNPLPPHEKRRGSAEAATTTVAIGTLHSHSSSVGNPSGVHSLHVADSSGLRKSNLCEGLTAHRSCSNGSHKCTVGLTSDAPALYQKGQQIGAETLQRQWYRISAIPSLTSAAGEDPTDHHYSTYKDDESVHLRRDELGYAHPDANYVVADINDDEFLFMRTGPHSHTRREAESAALARLAARRAALDRCTVDEPSFLLQLRRAVKAVTSGAAGAEERRTKDEEAAGESVRHGQRNQSSTRANSVEKQSNTIWREDDDDNEEEDGEGAQSTEESLQLDEMLPFELSEMWRNDDPLDHLRRHALRGPDDDDDNGDCTSRLWSWTQAEAHRWYFDQRVPLHHVLTDGEIDRAILVDLPLISDDAKALQCCGGYYRALGQYTSSFLTHKALQLTLLPPYGSLYRLTTQFLDVCLLQNSAVAVRIVDVWIASVDAALEMMAEREEAAMAQAVIAGANGVPAPLARLTDQQLGLDLNTALMSLNTVFQREWAACVQNGESTVKLEWSLSRERDEKGHSWSGKSSAPALARPGSTQHSVAETGEQEVESANGGIIFGDDNDADVPDRAAPSLGWHHRNDDRMDPTQERGADEEDTQGPRNETSSASQVNGRHIADNSGHRSRRPHASPIQSFLTALQLTVASQWCSGAWLLPDRTTHCLGGVCRTLLFWKSVERVVLHTWRAGMSSGLSSVFFFCTTVRQVLLSTLQEKLWGRLTEVTATYRRSLRFEAGVLYTYRALENFTVDHETFLQDCEFYTLCGAPFQHRVQPLLRAMMREVEVAERALRFAQVSIQVARRQYMATYRSMVSSSDSSSSVDSDEDDDGERGRRGSGALKRSKHSSRGGAASSSAQKRKHKSVPVATVEVESYKPRVFTPSRWCRHGQGVRSGRGSIASSQSLPLVLQSTEDAASQQREASSSSSKQQSSEEKDSKKEKTLRKEKKDGDNARSDSAQDDTKGIPIPQKMKTKKQTIHSAARTPSTQSKGDEERRAKPMEERSNSTFSTATTNTNSTFLVTTTNISEVDEGNTDDMQYSERGKKVEEKNDEKNTAQEETTAKGKMKHRRAIAQMTTTTTTKASPRRSIVESATMNTTPIYAAVLAAQQKQSKGLSSTTGAQKRSRSAGASLRQSHLTPLPPPTSHQTTCQASSVATASSLGMKRHGQQHQYQDQGHRHRRKGPRKPRMTPPEGKERRAKLRMIAERKIREETEHQRRLMRDVVARQLRSFAALTQSLRDALSDIIAKEDVAAQETLKTSDANDSIHSTAAAAKALYDAQRHHMSRFTYLSSMVRRLDSLIEVMASQV